MAARPSAAAWGSDAMAQQDEFDEIHDVVVVGTGAGGMSAALTAAHHGLDVLMLEKTKTSAAALRFRAAQCGCRRPASGSVGLTDSREDVVTYL